MLFVIVTTVYLLLYHPVRVYIYFFFFERHTEKSFLYNIRKIRAEVFTSFSITQLDVLSYFKYFY